MFNANKIASKRVGIHHLRPTEIEVLYTIRRIPRSTNASIIRYLRKMQNKGNENAVSFALKDLTAKGLLIRTANDYTLSHLGIEWMNMVRRYLLNIRL